MPGTTHAWRINNKCRLVLQGYDGSEDLLRVLNPGDGVYLVSPNRPVKEHDKPIPPQKSIRDTWRYKALREGLLYFVLLFAGYMVAVVAHG